MSSINLNHRLGLSSWEPRKSCLRWPMNRLAQEEMSGVEGEVIVGKDKLCELDKELSGWLGVARALYVYLGLRAHQHLRS